MSYFANLDLMRGTPCLLDEIAALRGEATSWEDVTFPSPPRCATCGAAIAGGITVDGTLRCIDCVAALRRRGA